MIDLLGFAGLFERRQEPMEQRSRHAEIVVLLHSCERFAVGVTAGFSSSPRR